MLVKACYLCGYERFIEEAHVVPRRLFASIFKRPKYMKTIPLCPNHHRLYDHNLLDDEEKRKIAPLIRAELVYLARFVKDFDKYYLLKAEYENPEDVKIIKDRHRGYIIKYLMEVRQWVDQA